jgi:tricorn protease
MWVGDTIYFLSDRSGPVSLFVYNTSSKQVTEVVKNNGLDFKSASAGPDAIVYEQFGSLHVYDLKTRKEHAVNVRLTGDLPEIRPQFRKLSPNEIFAAGISPTGARALFMGHGEIFTVPAEKGDIRNLNGTVAVEEREPAWSPDGKSIAHFSDASGGYELEIRDQSGLGDVRRIGLGTPPVFPYSPHWSPDSSKILYSDKQLNLWYLDIEKGVPVRMDTDTYAGPTAPFNPSWSPDSKWVAYTKSLKSHLHAVFVYSLEQGKAFQITDGMSDAANAVFDQDGKYLYFTASTDTALNSGWLDMSSMQRPVTRTVYVIVLTKDLPSPLAPESDEEKPASQDTKEPDETAKKGAVVQIDFDNISQRVLALPIPARNYTSMSAGKTGVLFLEEAPAVQAMDGPPEGRMLQMFDLKTRKTEKIRDGISGFFVSANGEKMLYRQGQQYFIAAAGKQPPGPPPAAGEGGGGPLKLDTMEAWVDPRAEWNTCTTRCGATSAISFTIPACTE